MLITRALVKVLLTFSQFQQSEAKLFFEPNQMKSTLDEARSLNDQVLLKRHSYSKLQSHLDAFELELCGDYLDNA